MIQTTTLPQWSFPVIVTEGGIVSGSGRIYGVFADEQDARSSDADRLALGTIGPDSLTAEQREIAAANTEALSD